MAAGGGNISICYAVFTKQAVGCSVLWILCLKFSCLSIVMTVKASSV